MAPKGTPGYESEALLRQYFPQYINQGTLVVLLRRVAGNGTVVDCDFARNFTYYLRDSLTGAGYPFDPDFAFDFQSC